MKPRLLSVVVAALVVGGGTGPEAKAQGPVSKAAPPASIPTVSLNNVARHGFFYDAREEQRR